VFAECLSVFSDLRQIEQELESLSHSLAELDPATREYAEAADRYQRLEGEFRARDGYALEAQAGTVLGGLGFRREDWTQPCENFSGGWQMRIALAKLLLQKPNLLLLDEPTNHLDLESRNWLEGYLNAYPFAYVLVSHDRYFLDVTVERIAEIWNQRVHFYAGNYDSYERLKQQQREQLEAAYRNQRDRIEQLEAFINRFRYQATKAKQVQSRIKELERIERITIPPEEKAIHFSFPQPIASGRMVAEATNLGKTYGVVGDGFAADAKTVFRSASFMIDRGDRIALVGPNGAGKSTLIKLLGGLERPTAGDLRLGHNVQADYFAQDQYRELDAEARVLDGLWSLAPARSQTELRNLLGCFLFSGDDVFKRVGVLSGGERNRYALARMLLSPPITSTCAPKTFCWKPSGTSPAPLCSSRTTATSLTGWRPGYSKSAKAKYAFTVATTKTTGGRRSGWRRRRLPAATIPPRRRPAIKPRAVRQWRTPMPSPSPVGSIPSVSARCRSGARNSKTWSPGPKSISPAVRKLSARLSAPTRRSARLSGWRANVPSWNP